MTTSSTGPSEPPGGPARLRKALRSLADSSLDLLFPPRCAHCKRPGSLLCEPCIALIPHLPDGPAPAHLDTFYALGGFDGPLRSAIHAFKYDGQRRMAGWFGERLAALVLPLHANVIAPVPLHPKRERERGYNQSALLASEVAERLHIPHDGAVLRRTRVTQQQALLGYADRAKNVRDAFSADAERVHGKAIILIDDVCTSGATLSSCAAALRTAGALHIYGLTVARTLRDDPS